MRNFPGRTLDELDQMDWGRYLRAVEAQHIEAVEGQRAAQMEGNADPDTKTWESILRHDELMEMLGNGQKPT